MEKIISYSFVDFSFKNELVDDLLREFSFKKIERYINFQWETADPLDKLSLLESDQIRFRLKTGGDKILIQNLNNALPRLFGDRLDENLSSTIVTLIESKYNSLINYGYTHDYVDYSLNNTDQIDAWEIFNREIISDAIVVVNSMYRRVAWYGHGKT